MTLSEINDLTGIITSILTSLSILIGGVWVIYKFILQQERYPNINFLTDINVIGKQDGVWIIEIIALIENKGKAQHKMKDFKFDLNALFYNDKVGSSDKWGGQVNFIHPISSGSYLPKHADYFFIDPGTTAKYSYVTMVSEKVSFLILHSNFTYYNRKGYAHTAEKSIQIK